MWPTHRLQCFKYKFGLLQLLRKHFISLIFLAVAHDIVHVACLIAENYCFVASNILPITKKFEKYIVTSIMLFAVRRKRKLQAFLYNCNATVP